MGLREFAKASALLMRLSGPGTGTPGIEIEPGKTQSGTLFDSYRKRRKTDKDQKRGQATNGSVWIILHGITVNGNKEPRLMDFAASLARCGVTCVVPKLDGLASCQWLTADLDALTQLIIKVSNDYDAPVGLIGFSYGGSYCLLAAAREIAAKYVRHVIAFGAYNNMAGLFDSFLNKQDVEPKNAADWDEMIYRCLVLLYSDADKSRLPAKARQEMQLLLENYCSHASLKEKKAFYYHYLKGLDLSQTIQRIIKPGVLAALSPRDNLPHLICPVTLIHQRNDRVIPIEQGKSLYKTLQKHPNSKHHKLLITSLLSHVSSSNLLRLYEAPLLVRALAPVFA
ncbi:MAG: alpha/beta hydrolase [bacterium]|nr:alpha/beta hydrolase [bacterium]